MSDFHTDRATPGHPVNRMVSGWNRFWFTPRDPTTLAVMRVLTGLVTLYTFIAYSFDLQALIGPHAWMNLETRLEMVHEGPTPRTAPNWEVSAYVSAPKPPTDPEQKRLFDQYQQRFTMAPPLPHARTAEENDAYMAYREKWGEDPRVLLGKGRPVWSLWFHITEPTEMAVTQGVIVVICFCFLIGFCTRLTSVLTWLAALSYIHRAPASLFGVDTMMVILLLYLAIGPCGAALSVDRLIARWWSQAGPDVIRRWRKFWHRPEITIHIAPPPEEPAPSVSAMVATRLLQIHVCVIYLAAGLSKFQGQAWWTGHAVWGTMANPEFAPMNQAWYLAMMRALGENRVVFEVFFTCAAVFTLSFEIAYAFLIWRPWARPILLGMAFVLHGFIGMFMSLRTFSMLMVVLNLAFVDPETMKKWLRYLARKKKTTLEELPHHEPEPAAPEPAVKAGRPVIAGRGKRRG